MAVEDSSSIEAGGQMGLALAELPVSSKFAGGGHVYLKMTPDTAVEIQFGPRGEVVGYGSTIPLSEFPDVRFDPMDEQEVMTLQAEHRSIVGQGLVSSVCRRFGGMLRRFSSGGSSNEA